MGAEMHAVVDAEGFEGQGAETWETEGGDELLHFGDGWLWYTFY